MSTSSKVQQALQALLKRSCVDYEFRQQLLVDPRQAIREALGVIIPVHFHLKFIEKDEGVDALVVLPDFHRQDRDLCNAKRRAARAAGRGQTRLAAGGITRA